MSERQIVTILDDVAEIRTMLSDVLETAGFATRTFARASDFEREFARLDPAVCILDLGLPDKDGLALVHRLATESDAAVMIVSGRAMVHDKIVGLELGADDYITKPFDPEEVVARVRALLRRGGRAMPSTSESIRIGDWTCDFNQYTLTDRDGHVTDLAHGEAQLLRLFLDNPNRLVSRDHMLAAIGGDAGDSFDRAMDVRVSRLRTKLRDDPKNPKLIKTIYGAGYIFIGAD